MMVPRLKFALLICALASLAALGVALGSERYGGLVPCALCLVERWPYRVAAVIATLGLFLPRPYAWLSLVLCILVLLGAAGAGFLHVGVEQGWWESPLPECMAPRLTGLTIAQRLAQMPTAPSMACEDATYLIPSIPVSMAAMNMWFALALSFCLSLFAYRTQRSLS